MATKLSLDALTPTFRANFPHLFEPKAFKEGEQAYYSVIALFPKGADLTALKNACKAAVMKKWGEDPKKWPSKDIAMPFRDQEEKAKDVDGKRVLPPGHEAGAIFINLKSKKRPGVFDQNKNEIIDSSKIYSGCYMRAAVFASAYQSGKNYGVSLYLNAVQLVKDGEPLSGRARAEDAFSAINDESLDSSDPATFDPFA
jgi:hypothetical protein